MTSLPLVGAGLFCLGAVLGQAANPPKMATKARLDLTAGPAVGQLTAGQLVRGDGEVGRMTWLPAAKRPRGYTAQVAINHLGWTEAAVRFTPAKSGTVQLTLMGPWEEASRGTLYREEVLWDDLKVEGAALPNGSFEKLAGGKPVDWRDNGGAVLSASRAVPAVDGSRYARTWHNGTLSTALHVTGGMPVTLHFWARAAVPPGHKEMERIAHRDTPAHQAARRFLRGVNLGNYLEAPPGQDWGAHYSAADFRHIRQEGFDHVRIPIAWHHYAGPGPAYKLAPAIFAKVDALVGEAKKNDLNVLLDLHHFDEFTTDPQAKKAKFFALWEQIAAHYAGAPDSLALELLNEPKDAATTTVLNPIYAEAIRRIRKTNPKRTLFVGPGRWNQSSELVYLRLPDDDHNLVVTVHCYEPFRFTHQGASWAGPDARVTGIRYPGPPAEALVPPGWRQLSAGVKDWLERYNTLPGAQNPCGPRAFQGALRLARQWSDYYGRPVHVGEFGCYIKADPESRARFHRDFRKALEEAGLGWALWDWKAGFRYWDPEADRPAPGMHAALFAPASKK
jgi:endoglucanase